MTSDNVKPVLSVRVDQELLDRIDSLAEKSGVARAEVIIRALHVGLKDQEGFLRGFEGRVTGPILELLFNEKFLNVLYALTGDTDEIDPNQMKAIRTVREKSRQGKSKLRPAME